MPVPQVIDRLNEVNDPSADRFRGNGSRQHLSDEQLEAVDMWSRKIALQLTRGNRSAAHDLVDRGLDELARRTTHPFLDTPLALAGVGARTCNTLEKHLGVSTVEGLLNTTTAEMLMIPTFGPQMVFEALAAVAKYAVRRVIELEK